MLDHDIDTVVFYPYDTYDEVCDPRDRIKKEYFVRTYGEFEYMVDTILNMYLDAYTVMDGDEILSEQKEPIYR